MFFRSFTELEFFFLIYFLHTECEIHERSQRGIGRAAKFAVKYIFNVLVL